MSDVSVRDLRNHGGRVLDRVARGETLIVTRNRRPVAELRPLPSRPLSADEILSRWRGLPAVDGDRLRADVDAVMEPAL